MIACERLFGGASSAALVFATPQDTVLSLIFVPLTYFRARSGRSSIPEASALESKGRGVLDTRMRGV
jgi:hypothetical protein